MGRPSTGETRPRSVRRDAEPYLKFNARSGSERVLYAFKGVRDGYFPLSGLLAFNGAFYGTTQYGGRATTLCATGCGTLFELSAAGTKKTLHEFDFSQTSGDGAYPAAGPTGFGGELYGTTLGGGARRWNRLPIESLDRCRARRPHLCLLRNAYRRRFSGRARDPRWQRTLRNDPRWRHEQRRHDLYHHRIGR